MTLGDQEVAAVAVLDLDHIAQIAEVMNVFKQNNLHVDISPGLLIVGVGKEGEEAGTLDRGIELALVDRLRAGQTGGHDLAIFLDEIGEIPISLQAKLLRVLQEREIRRIGSNRVQPVDVRVISATNINIEEKIREGQFRADLYYRLNLLDITIPPLRERGDDIREMVDFYLTRFACEMGKPIPRLSKEAVDLMTHYGWPGNVRELRNICERLIVLSDTTEIGLREIQMLKIFRKKEGPLPGTQTPDKETDQPETGIVYANLKPRKKKQDIAKELGVSRTTLWRMEKMAREQKKQ